MPIEYMKSVFLFFYCAPTIKNIMGDIPPSLAAIKNTFQITTLKSHHRSNFQSRIFQIAPKILNGSLSAP